MSFQTVFLHRHKVGGLQASSDLCFPYWPLDRICSRWGNLSYRLVLFARLLLASEASHASEAKRSEQVALELHIPHAKNKHPRPATNRNSRHAKIDILDMLKIDTLGTLQINARLGAISRLPDWQKQSVIPIAKCPIVCPILSSGQ